MQCVICWKMICVSQYGLVNDNVSHLLIHQGRAFKTNKNTQS
uniref:Uncharacterized protein n=1 Tax=Rhizophora mucronata TaxID=61149 RepID=A0A2P2N110_RHIMU